MSSLTEYRLLSFDVYGTLIDWESGVLAALKNSVDSAKLDNFTRRELLDSYHKLERKSEEFGQSVGKWPAFPDTVDALRRLSKHYKLVVLSNVDRTSFAATNAGPLQGFPFDLIITAQDVGSYKPDPRNFDYMINKVKEELGVEKHEILQTAQSQFHDHHPAKKAGLKSSWIVRPGATMGNRTVETYDWKFDTLGDMADALEEELRASS